MSTGALDSTTTVPPDDTSGRAAPPAPADGLPDHPPQGYWKTALVDTFRNKRARYSAVWIGFLAFCAVFAPFLASSHPLLMKQGGHWSSPALHFLRAPDVMLLAVFVIGVVCWSWRPLPYRGRVFAALTILAIILSYALVPRRDVPGYETYRNAQRAGQIESAIYAPIRFSPTDRQFDREDVALKPPSREHWFGTDGEGQDVLSRIIHAARIALAVGFIATGIEVVIGVLVGSVMGYFVGRVDLIGMRLIEIFEAIPTLFLLITFTAFYERNLYMVMAIIGLTNWTSIARFVRGEFLRLRNQDFVHAARAAGLPLRSVLFRHMLPNALTPVLVSVSFGVASAILYESVLSFLGLGLVEEPSWGGLLDQANKAVRFVWWLALFPGLAIFFTVFAYNLIGESMRDALDPKLKGIK
jgi:peptide/nickel transport system permease protein